MESFAQTMDEYSISNLLWASVMAYIVNINGETFQRHCTAVLVYVPKSSHVTHIINIIVDCCTSAEMHLNCCSLTISSL